jgi:ABC-2 type transport system ATP-binding protein
MTVGDSTIKTVELTKRFKDIVAVNELGLEVKRGEVFGFLGPNGAGKTTTIRMIVGLTYPTSGTVYVNGEDMAMHGLEMKKSLGFLPEVVGFYPNLTARQTMKFYSGLKGQPGDQIEPLLEKVGLLNFADKKVSTFSRGMVQLLGFAQTLIGDPDLLILDEPAGGLDPYWIRMTKDTILDAKKRGATVFFSSHILGEVEEICDRVAIINQGSLAAEDTIENLRQHLEMKPRLWLQMSKTDENAVKVASSIDGVSNVHVTDNWLMVECDHALRMDVMNILKENGYQILNFRTEEPSLEDVFLGFTERAEGGQTR